MYLDSYNLIIIYFFNFGGPNLPNINPIILLLLLILVGISYINFAKNIIHVVIVLLFIYIITGVLFVMLGFDFLGYMIFIIYAGAIIILFIFVLMLIDMKKFKNKTYMISKLRYLSYILLILIVLNTFIFNYSNFAVLLNLGKIKEMAFFKFILSSKFFNDCTNLVETSPLVKTAYVLFSNSWFETIFIGFILLLALVFIIYLFRK
jgi:NADH-quinone oxidoreductase subunit J